MIALIVAYAKNRVIGKDGKIPWHIPGEQQRFKALTQGNVVVMGRTSYEEIGHPLPGRQTIVVSATKNFDSENCTTVPNLQRALTLAQGKQVFISGGAKLYEEALPLANKLYITQIDREIDGDTYFPNFDESGFLCTEQQYVEADIPYTYLTYERK